MSEAEAFLERLFSLESMINPLNDTMLSRVDEQDIVEACGLLPTFFLTSVVDKEPQTLLDVVEAMNKAYGFGGFDISGLGPFANARIVNGVYTPAYKGDEPLNPLVKMSYSNKGKKFDCYIYQYGIIALVDEKGGATCITRMD
jgi:hypothetical protein